MNRDGRFAPSPTGTLHIGNALSAVANRAFGDWMLLRIDDTDPARNVDGGEEAIVEDLRWLELEWDEFTRQSERAERSGRNPQTGETITIAASKSVKFVPASALKTAVNGAKE